MAFFNFNPKREDTGQVKRPMNDYAEFLDDFNQARPEPQVIDPVDLDPEVMITKRMMDICQEWEAYTIPAVDQQPVMGTRHNNVYRGAYTKTMVARWAMDEQKQMVVETLPTATPMEIIVHSLNTSLSLDCLP